jgi:hypothetical protein
MGWEEEGVVIAGYVVVRIRVETIYLIFFLDIHYAWAMVHWIDLFL